MKPKKPDPMWNDDPNGKPVTFKQIAIVTVALVALLAAGLFVNKMASSATTSQESTSASALNFR
ncbi:hypothetical protein [Pseudomonas sp. UMC65]|uniref:hypothetical protein n=1 Tax=Pseudomonas sp. UMC65 TaxID=1862323 RepID=UPI00160131E6|nr:hypothetical protein [Pseudomonas sp. UMC65]